MTLSDDFEPNPRAAPGGNKPPKAKRTIRRVCPETGAPFETTTHDRLFSTDKAKADFHNRSSKIGRSLVPLAMAWRAGRNFKGGSAEARAHRASAAKAFSEMCRILDAAVADDNANDRMAKVDYLRRRDALQGILQPVETVAYQTAQIAKEARAGAAQEKARKAAALAPAVTK